MQTESNAGDPNSKMTDNADDRSTAILGAIADVKAYRSGSAGADNGLLLRSKKDNVEDQRPGSLTDGKRRKRAQTCRRAGSQSASGQTSCPEEGPKNRSPSRQPATAKGDTSSWTEVVKRRKKTVKPTPPNDKSEGGVPAARNGTAKVRLG